MQHGELTTIICILLLIIYIFVDSIKRFVHTRKKGEEYGQSLNLIVVSSVILILFLWGQVHFSFLKSIFLVSTVGITSYLVIKFFKKVKNFFSEIGTWMKESALEEKKETT